MLIVLAIILIVLGLLFMWKSQPKKEEEKKSFLVLLGTIAFIWFFPGLALFVLGLACLISLVFGVGF